MKKFILLLVLMLTIKSFGADFYQASIKYNDGKILEGYASLPSNKITSGSVNFRQNAEGASKKLNDDDIQSIIYTTDSGNKYYFEHVQCTFLYGKNGQNIQKKKDWILMTSSNDLLITYDLSQSYVVNKDDKMVAMTVDRSGTWADVFVLFKKPGETSPSIIMSFTNGATVIGQDKKFRNAAKQFFKGEDGFIARIDNKEFKNDDVYKMAEAYVAYKQGK